MKELKETLIRPRNKFIFLNLSELWQFRDLFYTFGWRDIKVRYKQTVLGVLWVLLQPLVTTIVFTIFFGNYANIPSGNLPYSIFVMVGLIFWNYFSAILSRSSMILLENEHLVKKVYFPREILPFSAVLTAFIDFAISFSMLAVFIIYYGVAINFSFLLVVLAAIIITVLSASGLGLFLSSVNIKYRDIKYALPFFLQLMIFVTPVIYPLSIVRPSFQYILSINPMTGVITSLRSVLDAGFVADPTLLAISFASAVAMFLIGLFYFRLTEKYFADIL